MQNDAETADHPFLVRPHRTLLGLMLPVLLSLVAEPLTGLVDTAFIARFMGATADVHRMAADYIQIRLIGAPAVLATIAAFGCLRGLQDMRVPLLVAVGVNALNILLDAVLIFGWGPIRILYRFASD